MKKTIRYTSFALVLVALLIIPLFASCSASGNYANDEAYPELDYSKDENYEGGVSYAPDGSLTTDNAVNANRKIIRTFTVYGETKTYDDALEAINTSIAAAGGFINATDCADYLVSKGLPFRDAYKATGELVALCIKEGKTLETLSLDEYKNICELFDNGVYEAIKLENCVARRGM